MASSFTEKHLIDSDNDGMPDAWERKFGLNPHDASDGNGKTIDKYGQYTNLEMYMNSLVHDIIENKIAVEKVIW